MQYLLQTDRSNAVRLCELINQAYRGNAGERRWTTEAHLIEGDRITLDNLHSDIANEAIDLIAGIEDGQVVCCIAIKYLHDVIEFGAFAVDPQLCGQGLGKATLAYAETHAKARAKAHGNQFQVIVVSQNAHLINFYRKRGYVDSGEQLPFPEGIGVGVSKRTNLTLTVLTKPA